MDKTDDDFDQLVKGLYRAGARLQPWKQALDAISTEFSAWNAHLMGLDLTTGVMQFSHEGGDPPPEGTLDYIRKWHRVDPRVGHGLSAPPGTWVHDHEIFDDAFVESDPFYRDFLIPYGMRYVSGVCINLAPNLTCVFSVSRAVGKLPFNDAERRLLRRLAVHLEEALIVHQRQSDLIPRAQAGLAVLERLRYPVLLIDRERTVFFCNQPAKDLAVSQPLADWNNGRFRFKSLRHDRELTVLIKSLELGTLGQDGTPTVLFVEARPGEMYVVHLSDARPQNAMGAFGPDSMVLITIFEMRAATHLDPFVVQAAFGLTPAEARVATMIAEGSTPEEIAALRRVSLHTVRVQLSTVMAKMGVTRQPAICTLLAGNPAYWGSVKSGQIV